MQIRSRSLEANRTTEQMFTDDMAILAASEKNLQYKLDILNKESDNINMKINITKTEGTSSEKRRAA